MEAASDIGAGDDPEHGLVTEVIAELPAAESLAQVGVEVDVGHRASLLGDPGQPVHRLDRAYCLTTLAAICVATSIAAESGWP